MIIIVIIIIVTYKEKKIRVKENVAENNLRNLEEDRSAIKGAIKIQREKKGS